MWLGSSLAWGLPTLSPDLALGTRPWASSAKQPELTSLTSSYGITDLFSLRLARVLGRLGLSPKHSLANVSLSLCTQHFLHGARGVWEEGSWNFPSSVLAAGKGHALHFLCNPL